ncbi:tRNA-specific adenosine deaminase subunit tad3 [Lambiella insularis]|nr:tRNA-specific adenosine deaminase subunit tad3 [Lambiella insularis]
MNQVSSTPPKDTDDQSVQGAAKLDLLHTKAEAQSRLVIIEVHVVLIPLRSANRLLRTVDEAISLEKLQHLRRFAKASSLSTVVRERLHRHRHGNCDSSASFVPSPQSISANVADHNTDHLTSVDSHLYFLICPTTTLSREEAVRILVLASSEEDDFSSCLRTLPVPARPPKSHEQAVQWSRDYWPTVYKKHHPDTPHPSIAAQMRHAVGPFAAKWLDLAKKVSVEAADSCFGEQIGAAVVNPGTDAGPAVVVAAGDARWKMGNAQNPMSHAVMRAIGMVARRRREIFNPDASDSNDLSLDHPLTLTEHTAYSSKALLAGGYLCMELEIYVTHEPCVMCSMAILHSRFTKVVFATRMPQTGALTAENQLGLGYGLWWLPELNWRLLCWQYTDGKTRDENLCRENVHA